MKSCTHLASGRTIAFVVLFTSLLLSGCRSTTTNLNTTQVVRVQRGERSLVLFHVTDPGSQPRRQRIDSITWQKVSPEISSQEISQVPAPKEHHRILGAPTTSRAAEGWRMMMLSPGNYSLSLGVREVRPASDTRGRPPIFTNTSSYQLAIPPGQRIVYGGSFQFELIQENSRSFGVDGPRARIEPRRMPDETDLALRVGREMFAELGAFLPTMETPRDLQTTLSNMTEWTFVAVESLESTASLTNTKIQDKETPGQIAAAPLFLPGMALTLLPLSDDDEDEDNSYMSDDDDDDPGGELLMAGAGLALIVASLPVAYLVNQAADSSARRDWAPHEAALKKEIAEFNLGSRLTDSLKADLMHPREEMKATNTATELVLQLEVYRIGLRPWEKYALEVGVHARILDAHTRKVMGEHGFVHTTHRPDAEKYLFAPYETLIETSSVEHPLEAYKGKDGIELFRAELERAKFGLRESIARNLMTASSVDAATNAKGQPSTTK